MVVNPWILLDYSYGLEWYIHDAGVYVANWIQALIILRLTTKIQLLFKIAKVLLGLRTFQLLTYFACYDWFPAAVAYAIIFLVSAFVFIKSHKDNPHTIVNANR
jgi:hypothetical protein